MAPGGAPAESGAALSRGDVAPATTTLSTIAVRAGPNANLVVALLKSSNYIQLRIDEMRPKLLAIGATVEETNNFLKIHEDLMARLRDKDEQVQQLLTRTDGLSAEKADPNEAAVYDAMAKSLTEAWRTLNRQLLLRGYLLRETLRFYQMADSHQQLAQKTEQILAQINAQNKAQLQQAIDQIINDIIDTTATAVDLGSSVIAQIRTLGQVDDNPERPQEILDSCVLIETVMLRVASDWERTESSWQRIQRSTVTTEEDELVVIEQWLTFSEKRVKALNENGQKQVLSDGNKHVARLRELSSAEGSDGGRISHLSGRIEEFLHYLKTRMNRSQRIHAFLQSAKSMLSQLGMMVSDMKNANAAMAGELAPLAKQKAMPLIAEGKDISAKEVLSYEEQRLVKQMCSELEQYLAEIEELAKQRQAVQTTNTEVDNVKAWLEGPATAFLAQKGDMGGNLNDAREFVAVHKQFATDVINRDATVMALLAKKSQMSSEEERQLTEFVKQYEKLKDILENRIQLGTTYEQVHKFAKDLEGSFDALQTLLENNQEFTNDKIAAQIANVFQMIQETLSQEKHQGEKFIANATQIGKSDEWLNIQRAQEAVRNLITDHENRFKYVSHKWSEWQRNKNSQTQVEQVIEEIQMWQEDVLEYIAKVDRATVTSKQESEEISKKLAAFRTAADQHAQRLESLKTATDNQEQLSRIMVTIDKQDYIKQRLVDIQNKIELSTLLRVIEDVQIWQEEAIEIIRNVDQIISTTTTNQEQIENLRKKVSELNVEVAKKSQHLDSLRTLSQNQIYQEHLSSTIVRQEKIQQNVEILEKKLSIATLIKKVEEVQMWQEEAIEIIRLIDASRPISAQESKEIIDRIHDLKETVEHKSTKIAQLKTLSAEPVYTKRIEEVEQRQEQIKQLTVQLEEKFEEQKLVKVTEDIQMWQEEMIEIVRLLDSTPMKSIQESEELIEKVTRVKKAIEQEQPKIDQLVAQVRREPLVTKVANVVQQQTHLRQMVEMLEQKARNVTVEVQAQQPPIVHEEKKTVELTSLEKTEIYLTPEEEKQLRILKRIVEEIQMWQEEMVEIIRLIEKSPPRTIQEADNLVQRVSEIKQTVDTQTQRIEQAQQFTKDTKFTETVHETLQRQQLIEQLVKELHERAETQKQVIRQQEVRQRLQAPQILTQLRDAEVDEGSRFEFAARIEGEPEPVITWLKDGIDVKSNIDYRQEFINGVASLVIEESFIEDTATYTVRATNDGGRAESSARLIVKSRSAMSSTIPEEDKPRFVKQLTNVSVSEGETAQFDCVVVGRPEPQVTWYKEEEAVKESERVHLGFSGDHCQMIIEKTVPLDTGMYTAKAKNVHGEVANFCQLKVAPKRQPPPPPPKPVSRPQSVVQRPPSIQPPLTNTIWQEGDTAVIKVFAQGEPRPRVHWKFNDQPLQTTTQVHVTEKDDGWSQVTIEQISPVHAGMYTAIAENEVGEAVTGATVHVQPSFERTTTTETHLQEDINERIGHPVQATTITKSSQQYEAYEQVPFPAPRAPSTIAEDKRWVEVIEDHFEEHMSQGTMSPIPQVTQTKKIESQQRWVDTIDEIWAPPPTTEIKETKTVTGADYYSAHRVHEPSPKPQAYTTIQTTTAISHIGQSHEPIQPDIQRTYTTESAKAMNIAQIRQSPQPEVHAARTTPGPTSEHAAVSRKTPVRETQQATITKAPSLENVAKIRQSPVPEAHRSTITRRSPSVENIAKIQPAVSQPDIYRATTTEGQLIGNIAQVHVPPEPDTRPIVKSAPKIDRIDDIVVLPQEDIVRTTVKQTITTTADVDRQQQQALIQKKEAKTSKTVTEETSGEGWIQHQYQDFTAPQTSTITVKRLDIEGSEQVAGAQEYQQELSKKVTTEKEEESKALREESRIPVRKAPQTTKTVTETTSGEGWIQQVHEDMTSLPHTSSVTVKRLDIEGGVQTQQQTSAAQQQITRRRQQEEEEEELRRQRESRIPVRQEPKTTKTVTETVSGEGWVQHVHDNMSQLPHTSTVTVKKLDIEDESTQMRQKAAPRSRPISMELRKQTDDESSVRQRDSFILASDVEGFWTDGAYTASPTPPPVPVHRMTAEDNMQRIGLSRTTTEPKFIKAFQKEYTVDEGGRLTIECVLVGNPKPKTRFFFNDKLITEKSEFLKISHVNDTYSIIIGPARLEHAGYYKIIAENIRGLTESLTVVHVRPRSLQHFQQKPDTRKIAQRQAPTEHTTVEEEFAMFEYEQRRPQKHEASKLATPPPAKRLQQIHKSDEEHLEQYDIEGKKTIGHPPHFTQTLVSTVAASGESARFEGIVTGWPAPTVEWTVDGKELDSSSVKISNIGGRVSLTFPACTLDQSGKYMCTAKNTSGVATSSAQLVVRPKTVAPDFILRLISEEVEEGTQLKWTVRVTGDPPPTVTWLRDGYEIPDCEEVRLLDEGNGVYSLVIVRVEGADSGQFTCLAENIAGEARSTADLVVRPSGSQPGSYFHVTKVTQERQAKGAEPVKTSAFSIENPKQSEML